MSAVQEKFQQLLRELFQFDYADLDFGIYRIMNQKRDVVDKFITRDLPRWVDEELAKGALAEQSHAAKELAEAREKVLEALGDDALDAAGILPESYQKTKAGKEYLAAQEKAKSARGREALETSIYNHLWSFFNRYYQDGDFISKRRYSKKERYAIPYNGEEVTLYWANHDQYYIKTGEYFTDYTWKAPNNVTVHFKLKAADVEQGNVKGEKRFFMPQLDDVIWDAKEQVLIIHFEYRPLTAQETISYGQKNQQENINGAAAEKIPAKLAPKTAADALEALCAEKQVKDDQETYLAYHLRQYTKRNTADFFIHKDLKGFLSRELDFYLKNEVLNLEEMEHAGENISQGWFQLMRVIKNIGLRIIEFLYQIEEFQKMLWEKRKFVTEVGYCITVGNIPKGFYSEIATCEAQWIEWKEIYHIDEDQTNLFTAGKSKKEKRIEFLKDYPTLVLDTLHFDNDFIDRLLAGFDDLDEITDGLLVHSENWQALNLLKEKYYEKVKCIYIDPPFNSPSTEILYKNDYKHSSWLTLLHNRIVLTRIYLNEGVYVIAIDENEQEKLGLLIKNTWLTDYENVCVSVRHNPRGIQGMNFSHCHEYAYFIYPSDKHKYIGERDLEEADVRNLRDSGLESDRSDARNCFYPFVVKDGQIIEIGDVAQDGYHPKGVNERDINGRVLIWPIDTNGREKKWRYARQSVQKILPKLEIRETRGKNEIYYAKDTGTVRTIWDDSKFDASEYGTKLLQQVFGTKDIDFSYPKSLYTIIETIRVTLPPGVHYILDYFAGSGTTGHALINLNREDGGRRKFILVEMADYFDTVLMPRIKKITFTPEWEDGKPERRATDDEAQRSPRIVKYMRLESYEDALNNIAFDSESGQQAMRFEDYLLSYMLKWESRQSDTMLNVEKLAKPFDYKLNIHRDGETRTQNVNLPETFGYLLGLHVQSRKVYENKDHKYLVYRGKTRKGQNIAIIWRETKGWTKEDFQHDRDFVAKQNLSDGADEIFVNGDSFIPNARALEPIFKAKMFAPVEG